MPAGGGTAFLCLAAFFGAGFFALGLVAFAIQIC
jgi:hypothetical protein